MTSSCKRYKSRSQAGELLAKKLGTYKHHPEAIILALPRGGLPVGYAIAMELGLPLDILCVRKLGVPGREEFSMGAIASGGVCIIKADVAEMFNIPTEVIETIAQRELREIDRREMRYRAGYRACDVHDKIVILVDDGLATGATLLAGVKALHKNHTKKIIVAVPVCAPSSCQELKAEVDELVCLCAPSPFYAVSEWYDDFTQVTDAEVSQFLAQAKQNALRPPQLQKSESIHQ